jgi:hypothetical protein
MFDADARDFSLLHNIETGSGAEGSFPRYKVVGA